MLIRAKKIFYEIQMKTISHKFEDKVNIVTQVDFRDLIRTLISNEIMAAKDVTSNYQPDYVSP